MSAAAGTYAARGLTKRFGSRLALDGVSFDLHAGEIVGIAGPNGAGKTTLLSILAGTRPPDTGSLSLDGRRAGWVPQAAAVYDQLSVAENLRLFARLERVDDVEAVVAAMLVQTGLGDRAAEPVGRLSGGNRQRVNIAVGVLSEPAVLLLDEPSASLDPRQRERLWEFITGLAARGTTVVFSTHVVAEVARYAARLLLLADGALLYDGPPEGLARDGGSGAARADLEDELLHYLRDHGH